MSVCIFQSSGSIFVDVVTLVLRMTTACIHYFFGKGNNRVGLSNQVLCLAKGGNYFPFRDYPVV